MAETTSQPAQINSLEEGAKLIRAYAKDLPDSPGVYRMLNTRGDVLYVGKAKSLKKRVVSYANYNKHPTRLKRLVAETMKMEFVHTATEIEALLLEANYIKRYKPRYNILLKDDKSFPYIYLNEEHACPKLVKHRGARKGQGAYFGPFATVDAVNRTLHTLQKVFQIRNCSDHVFANRSRPCLQYHIKRCTAPCVGYVSAEQYNEQVNEARQFLEGKSRAIQDDFVRKMEEASENEAFEEAAAYRDKVKALTAIQARQDINVIDLEDADAIGLARQEGVACIQAFFFRNGQNLGNRSYFPIHNQEDTDEAIMGAFIAQFYADKPPPPDILTSITPGERGLIEEALSEKSTRRVKITVPVRGTKKRLMDFVLKNAREALSRKLISGANEAKILQGVADLFGLDEPPQRIEVYDNSHISGTNQAGAMIVAGPEGFLKKEYRKFNIRGADKSDDYGMMREVFTRRFSKLAEDKYDNKFGQKPDIVLIDGGLGQFNAVKEVIEPMGLWEDILFVAIAKGVDRNAGREKFFMDGRPMFQLPHNDAVLHYLQRLRDEAHRFAIGAHRTRRSGDIKKSPLDDIPGIGAARKKALLHHFGSAKGVAGASVADLTSVPGISKAVAEKIYNYFRG